MQPISYDANIIKAQKIIESTPTYFIISIKAVVSRIVEKAIPLPNKKKIPRRNYRKELEAVGMNTEGLTTHQIYYRSNREKLKKKNFEYHRRPDVKERKAQAYFADRVSILKRRAVYRKSKVSYSPRRNCRKELEAMGMNTDGLSTKRIYYLATKEVLKKKNSDNYKQRSIEKTIEKTMGASFQDAFLAFISL